MSRKRLPSRQEPTPRREGAEETELLADVRELYAAVDPVPDGVIAAAQASLAWLQHGVEVAELTDDSAAHEVGDDEGGRRVRSRGGGRLLAFESPDANVVVEVREEGGMRIILGQVSGCRPDKVDIRHSTGVRAARADSLGRFRADIPAGPVSFACVIKPVRRLVTDWVSI